MPTLNIAFNTPEDENLYLEGNVRFASDFNTGSLNTIRIRGIGEWRNADANVVFVSKKMLENILTPTRLSRFDDTNIRVIGLSTPNWEILLPFKLRQKGVNAVKQLLTKFFKTISASASVNLESLASDEDTTNQDNG